MFCLDTNVVIGIINGRAPHLEARLRAAIDVTPVAIPAIVLFELRYGYARSNRRVQMEDLLNEFLAPGITVLPFDEIDAAEAGDIRANLEAQGLPIGPYDVLIAAQARRHAATLVTLNMREFSRVAGLDVTDWAA